jgi:hypothetical protein
MQKKGYSIYANTAFGKNKLNVVGLRNIDKDIGNPVTNYFTDIMVMFYYDDAGTRYERISRITTVPGLTYQLNKFGNIDEKKGFKGTRTITMQEGQYKDAYYQGDHRSTPLALVQRSKINYTQDKNLNRTYENDGSETSSSVGTNIHNSGKGVGPQKLINNWSAGCQVFRDRADFDWMSQAASHQINKTKYTKFTYTLMNIRDIEGFEKITTPV